MSPPAAGATAASGEAPPSPRELYTIPASSGWFRWDGIHETERQALPEFFGGAGGAGFGTATRNPRIYREYRDFIIGKYREDPARRLTFTEVRRALVGDVTLLRKLFAFLDSSGLINFSATDSFRTAGQQQEAGVVVEAPVGLQVTPRPPASYFAEEKRGAGGESGFRLPPLTSYSDVFGEWAPGKAPICGFCGEECKDGDFETLEVGFKVCSKCSKSNNDNKEEVAKCPADKKENVDSHASSAWTDAETLLLLEGVLKHGDDWDLIAQHVRTKNKSECIARLIQLPFGEHMLGTINGKSVSSLHMNQTTDGKMNQHVMKESPSQSTEMVDGMQTDGKEDSADRSAEEHPTKRRRLFSSMDATTSLMEQLALLTTTSSPDVLAAAADAAIKALGNEDPQARKAFRLSEREYNNKIFSSNHVQQIDCKVGDQDAEMQRQTVTDKKQDKKFIFTAYQVRAAVATAIGVAAARAKMHADQEEREMELLMASIVETQLRKIQYKIKHFEELELIMDQDLTVPPPDSAQQVKKIDEETLREVIRMGYDKNLLVESIQNRLQNEATVAYYLLLDNRLRTTSGYLGAECQEAMDSSLSNIASFQSPSSGHGNREQIFMESPIVLRPHFPAERKWALGLQSRAHPREIMTEVLKALQELNVYWKKIGHYNMKCRWSPGFPGQENLTHNNHNFSAESIETIDLSEMLNLIKFEIQLYKTRDEKYLLDLQRVSGPQLLFLDLCAAFLAQLRVL